MRNVALGVMKRFIYTIDADARTMKTAPSTCAGGDLSEQKAVYNLFLELDPISTMKKARVARGKVPNEINGAGHVLAQSD